VSWHTGSMRSWLMCETSSSVPMLLPAHATLLHIPEPCIASDIRTVQKHHCRQLHWQTGKLHVVPATT
jgi:hypothetical protein